jgi:gamma-glutamylcyclotransferase (GGCT)/AIG2-like uncharacterized protein YtfP
VRTGDAHADGLVTGELQRVVDPRAFRVLDGFERYDATDLGSSLYVRRLVRLADPPVDAWVYIDNRSVEHAERVADGDGRTHLAERAER